MYQATANDKLAVLVFYPTFTFKSIYFKTAFCFFQNDLFKADISGAVNEKSMLAGLALSAPLGKYHKNSRPR